MSLLQNFGNINAQKLNIEKDIQAQVNATATRTLRFADSSNSHIVTIPDVAANAELLTTESDLAADKLDIQSLTTNNDLAALDSFVYQDVSDSLEKKKISFAALSNAIEERIESGDTATENQIKICDASGRFQNVDMTGDCSIAADGEITLADKPAVKGTVEAEHLVYTDASNNIENVNDFGCVDVNASGNVVATGNVECDDNTLGGELFFSNKWKIQKNLVNNRLEFLENGPSGYVVRFSIQGQGSA